MTIRTSCPIRFSARGREPATSASPPVLAKGATSEATKTIFIGRVLSWCRCRHAGDPASRQFLFPPLDVLAVVVQEPLGRLRVLRLGDDVDRREILVREDQYPVLAVVELDPVEEGRLLVEALLAHLPHHAALQLPDA